MAKKQIEIKELEEQSGLSSDTSTTKLLIYSTSFKA